MEKNEASEMSSSVVVGMDGNVTFNPYSWNKLANVLFLEQWCWTLLDEAWTVARPLALHGFPPDL